MSKLHPIVQDAVQEIRQHARDQASKGEPPNFPELYFVLVSRNAFHAGEKLRLRCCGPRRIFKALNYFVFQVEDLRNGHVYEVHVLRLNFYHDASLDKDAILLYVLKSETSMEVQFLMDLIDIHNDSMV